MSESITIEDEQQMRFGHTITSIPQNNQDEPSIIMFGGARGSSQFTITNDIFVLNRRKKEWKPMTVNEPQDFPTPRASHAAASIGPMQMVVFGGARAYGRLVDNGLYMLSIFKKYCVSKKLKISSVSPSSRYGHTLNFVPPYLVLFGGNMGSGLTNELWTMNMKRDSYKWVRVTIEGPQPSPRIYHFGASWCAPVQIQCLLVFGGKLGKDQSSGELWGLKKNPKKKWEWIKASTDPAEGFMAPTPRAQHYMVCVKNLLIITGGKNSSGVNLDTDIYDLDADNWLQLPSVPRYKHKGFVLGNVFYNYGGLNVDSMDSADEEFINFDLYDSLAHSPELLKNLKLVTINDESVLDIEQEEDIVIQSPVVHIEEPRRPLQSFKLNPRFLAIMISKNLTNHEDIMPFPMDVLKREKNRLRPKQAEALPGPSILEILAEKMIAEFLLPPNWENKFDANTPIAFPRPVIKDLCNALLPILREQPTMLSLSPGVKIFGSLHGHLKDLLHLFKNFGIPVLHHSGQTNTDIEANDYLFLGNYVDIGTNSLEVVLLLFALKARYPNQIHLLRGAHECKKLNSEFGLAQECRTRLKENPFDSDSVYEHINKVFEYLPLAAKIGEDVLCVPSGIGSVTYSLQEIASIQRPLKFRPDHLMFWYHQLAYFLMMSTPFKANEHPPGLGQSPQATGILSPFFDEDHVEKFKKKNKIATIICSNRIVSPNAFEFKKTSLFCISSYTCGQANFEHRPSIMHFKKNCNTLQIRSLGKAKEVVVEPSVQSKYEINDCAGSTYSTSSNHKYHIGLF